MTDDEKLMRDMNAMFEIKYCMVNKFFTKPYGLLDHKSSDPIMYENDETQMMWEYFISGYNCQWLL